MVKDHSLSAGTLTRRKLLVGAGVGAGALAAPAILGPALHAQENTVYINTYGGSWTNAEIEAYSKPFTQETGIAVRTVTPVVTAKRKAQVMASNYEWDFCTIDGGEFEQAKREGLLEPIDHSVVDVSKIPKENILGDCAIAAVALTFALTYRKDKYPQGGPKNWADFWDVKKFPGARSFYNRPWTALGQALLADGVPLDKVYPMDLDRAFKKMDQIKPHVKVWWEQNTQAQQLIKDGEVDMIQMPTARAQELIDQGVPLEIVWNGAETHWSYWFVSKGSPRAKAAWKYIALASRPDRQAAFCNLLPYGPAHPDAFKFIDAKTADKLPTKPEHLAEAFIPDANWLAPRLDGIKERWTQWIAM